MRDVMERKNFMLRRPVNQQAHDHLHGPATLVYNSPTTLTTDVGPGLRMPRGGQITRISGRVAGAPSGGKLEAIINIDGVNALGTNEYLTWQDGEKIARYKIVRRPYFNEESVFTIDIQTINGATGPMIITIEYLPAY